MRKLLIIGASLGALIVPATASASTGDHWCRQGDPPILASSHTSCGLAGAIVTGYINAGQPKFATGRVTSPVTHKLYWVSCTRKGPRYDGSVTCHGRIGLGIRIKFHVY